MSRLLFLVFAFLWAGLSQPVAAQSGAGAGLPARPSPFQFVNDQAQLMAPADVKKLESGLRRYAENTGTQVVVVTVPSLGGRTVADYARGLGESWGVGQRGKNNGVVVLISQQERRVSIQPGSGLRSAITPAVTSEVIGQMTPGFKQGNYFAGLRTGLNTLMARANPDSAPQNAQTDAAGAAATAETGPPRAGVRTDPAGVAEAPVASTPNDPLLTPPTSEPSSGFGIGTILIGALAVGGLLWVLLRLFRRKKNNAPAAPAAPAAHVSPNPAPDFLPNANKPGPDFLPNRNAGPGPTNGPNNLNNPGNAQRGGGNTYNTSPNQGGGIMGGGGSGMGGILATGAAAAAGAYLGNRMASGHEAPGHGLAGDGSGPRNFDPNTAAGAAGAGTMGTGAADDYFSSRDGGATGNAGPDYFADDLTENTSQDYFSPDDSAYDDPSSGDFGGGDFDSDDDNSGSW